MEITPEELAERRLVTAGRTSPAKLPDLLDVGAVEPDVLICPEREDAAEGGFKAQISIWYPLSIGASIMPHAGCKCMIPKRRTKG